jgi:hypothetical protein
VLSAWHPADPGHAVLRHIPTMLGRQHTASLLCSTVACVSYHELKVAPVSPSPACASAGAYCNRTLACTASPPQKIFITRQPTPTPLHAALPPDPPQPDLAAAAPAAATTTPAAGACPVLQLCRGARTCTCMSGSRRGTGPGRARRRAPSWAPHGTCSAQHRRAQW